MPCFSCKCFSEGKGRQGERLNAGLGYCKLHDQEYWRRHECREYAPVWYGSDAYDLSFKKPSGFRESNTFKRSKKDVMLPSKSSDINFDEIFEDEEDYEETVSKDSNVRKASLKNNRENKNRMRKSMKICMWSCFTLSLIYIWLEIIIGELLCLAGAAAFGVFSVMFLLLGLTPKETHFLLKSKIKKSHFVTVCTVIAFIMFAAIAVYAQNNI